MAAAIHKVSLATSVHKNVPLYAYAGGFGDLSSIRKAWHNITSLHSHVHVELADYRFVVEMSSTLSGRNPGNGSKLQKTFNIYSVHELLVL